MTLSNEQKDLAKAKAKEYLEFSIFTLALMLGVNVEEIDESWTNQVNKEENYSLWEAHNSLELQVKAYYKL